MTPTTTAAAIPAACDMLTVSLSCHHGITTRYEPDAPQGLSACADTVFDAVRNGWVVPDEPGLAREGWLYARADGVPVASWLVPNLVAFHWLRRRLGLAATTRVCPKCDPMNGRGER